MRPQSRFSVVPFWPGGPALAAGLLAVAASAQPFPANRLDFSNWWIVDRQDTFPNFYTMNAPGDGLFKVLPRTVLGRDEDHLVSGYELAIAIDSAYSQTYPVPARLPSVQLYRTEITNLAGLPFEVPDLDRKVGPEFGPIPLLLPDAGPWVVEVHFDPQSGDPNLQQLLTVPARTAGQRDGLAIMALAEPGRFSHPFLPNVVMQASYNERHFAPGYSSHSGSYDSLTGTLAMYGTQGQPSATGELYALVRFANPTLQLLSDSAGGVANDPTGQETHMGPGAYASDHATRFSPGWFGLYIQAEQFDPGAAPPTHMALPFVVSTSAAGPTASLDLGGASLRIAPGELATATLLVDAGLGGPLRTYPAASGAGYDTDQLGVHVTPHIPLPVNPAWKGTSLWIQALVVDSGLNTVGATNVVRWTFD